MVHKDITEFDGVVTESLPNANFRVKFADDRIILGIISGKMRRFRIRVMPGDRVKVEMTPYDDKRGRITYRYK